MNILDDGEVLESSRKPIRISYKVYIGTHVKDVEEDEDDEVVKSLTPIVEGVATRSPIDDLTIFNFYLLSYCRYVKGEKRLWRPQGSLILKINN